MKEWKKRQLSFGTNEQRYHSHSYYDVHVFDSTSSLVCGHELSITGRHPTPSDTVQVGYVDIDEPGNWNPVGESCAWSWQQGPMTQWIPHSKTLVWNDAENGKFLARLYSVDTGESRTIDRPIYAINPQGTHGLSLNMSRLDTVRPGYGYAGGIDGKIDQRKPKDDGVWLVDLKTGDSRLVFSLAQAVKVLYSKLSLRQRLSHLKHQYVYWFNHAKFSPDGSKFTIKLRFRSRDPKKGWDDRQGVSLTCNADGSDARYLTHATSHVIWQDNESLYLWQRKGLFLYGNEAKGGRLLKQIAPDLINKNVHIRHFANDPSLYVFDTPYQETIDLYLFDGKTEQSEKIGTFENHVPKHGPFRCDLHPCPSPDSQKLITTSMQDGGRQMYLLIRE